MGKSIGYTGHSNNEPGLQKHSMGDDFPWTIVGYGWNPVYYRAENLRTGEQGPKQKQAAEAAKDIRRFVGGCHM